MADKTKDCLRNRIQEDVSPLEIAENLFRVSKNRPMWTLCSPGVSLYVRRTADRPKNQYHQYIYYPEPLLLHCTEMPKAGTPNTVRAYLQFYFLVPFGSPDYKYSYGDNLIPLLVEENL